MPSSTSKLTNKQKNEIIETLMTQAGNLVEFWGDYWEGLAMEPPCTAQEAADYLGKILYRLPGSAWDDRLTKP